MSDTIKLTDGQRETLTRAAEKGRVVIRGRRSPHHQRLADRGLLKRGGSERVRVREWRAHRDLGAVFVTRFYRSVVWFITADGRRALNPEVA